MSIDEKWGTPHFSLDLHLAEIRQFFLDVMVIVFLSGRAASSKLSAVEKKVGQLNVQWYDLQHFGASQVLLLVYPLVNKQETIENGHRNSGFTHLKW